MRKSQEELKLFHMSDNEKFMVGNEAMRRWKFITLNTCIRKKGLKSMLSFHLKNQVERKGKLN